MSKLTGKVAVVTGASKSIGSGIATALAAAGARVAVNLHSSDKKGAERVAQAIIDSGGEAIAVGADVSGMHRRSSVSTSSCRRLNVWARTTMKLSRLLPRRNIERS
jgi:3-oxoacyl-[acyl-carrier protein] reductase